VAISVALAGVSSAFVTPAFLMAGLREVNYFGDK